MSLGIAAAERGWLPDWLVRAGIRSRLRRRLRDARAAAADGLETARARHLDAMRAGPIAYAPDAANAQHYDVPAEFFRLVLGRRLKYSCCWWPDGVLTLDAAEAAMLRLTCDRAEITDGMRVLDLGCGWGAWALWVAESHPGTAVVAVSNAAEQRRHIERTAAARGLTNLTVITADINTFRPDAAFDRIVSVEMFEHVRNYERLLSRIRRWLAPDGKLFVHVFCHRRYAYFFENADSGDWMARHFFTGGMMPSDDLLGRFERQMQVEHHWRLNGRHYERTLRAWLGRLDARRSAVEEVLAARWGPARARIDTERWRLFFLACAELFGYAGGQEWLVSHYLLRPAGRDTDG